MKRIGLAVMLALATAAGAAQQSGHMDPKAHTAFEVEAIKLAEVDNPRQGFHSNGNRLEIENETVASMLMFAYGLQHKQIVGEPAWVNDTAFTINGVLNAEGEPNTKQWQEILQTLLTGRFRLKLHRDKRDLSYFALRPSGTLKLAHAAKPDGSADQSGNGGSKGMSMTYTSNTMADFVLGMNFFTDRPVVNETGLEGCWDFTLRWMPDQLKVTDLPADAPPGLFTAIKDQLGLKLEPAKGPVEVLVVESIEKPTAN